MLFVVVLSLGQLFYISQSMPRINTGTDTGTRDIVLGFDIRGLQGRTYSQLFSYCYYTSWRYSIVVDMKFFISSYVYE
jgi:hypothetical protein